MFDSNSNEEHQDVMHAFFNAVKHLYSVRENLKSTKYIKSLTQHEINLLKSYQLLLAQLLDDITKKIT